MPLRGGCGFTADVTPFTELPRNEVFAMLQRQSLLAKPCEFFKDCFQGRVPTLQEKLLYIEQGLLRASMRRSFQNDLYHVTVASAPPFIHLTISRRDGQPCHEWAHFQQIKNELAGPECEAIELYPAESRLVNTSHEYHLWVCADAAYRFPVGFHQRFVCEQPLPTGATDLHLSSPPLATTA